jgi:hypothetical protein
MEREGNAPGSMISTKRYRIPHASRRKLPTDGQHANVGKSGEDRSQIVERRIFQLKIAKHYLAQILCIQVTDYTIGDVFSSHATCVCGTMPYFVEIWSPSGLVENLQVLQAKLVSVPGANSLDHQYLPFKIGFP